MGEKLAVALYQRAIHRIHRKGDGKFGACARLAFDFDLPPMMVNQEETGHEIDAEFFRVVVADEEWVKDGSHRVRRETRAIVLDDEIYDRATVGRPFRGGE